MIWPPVEAVASTVSDPFDRLQAESRRRMEAGPECHPGIESDDDIAGPRAMAPPRWPDHEAASEAQHREVGLPGLGPVRLMDEPGRQLADRSKAEGLEMAQRLARFRYRPSRCRFVTSRHVCAHDGRSRRVDPRPKAFVGQLERRLDARAAGCDPAEDLRHGLDGLDVGGDG